MKKSLSMSLAFGFLFAVVIGMQQDITSSQGMNMVKEIGVSGSDSSQEIGISPRRCPPYC